jgi:ATP-dependent DNA ligase
MNQFILNHVSVEKCIIDGEMVAYDRGAGSEGGSGGGGGGLIPFGSNRTVAADEMKLRERGETPSKWLFFIVFDVLHTSGEGSQSALSSAAPKLSVSDGDVSSWPLASRRRLLKEIVSEVPRRLEFVKCEEVGEGTKEMRCAALAAFFNRAVETGQEGLVVKDLSSPYLIGEKSRAKSHWVGCVVETFFDGCVVLR